MFRGFLVKDSRLDELKETVLYFISGEPVWNKGYRSWRQDRRKYNPIEISDATNIVSKPKEYIILTVEEYEALLGNK